MNPEELDRVIVIPQLKVIGAGGAVAFAAYLSMEFASKPETWPVFLEFLKAYGHPAVEGWAVTHVNNPEARTELIAHAANLKAACNGLAQFL